MFRLLKLLTLLSLLACGTAPEVSSQEETDAAAQQRTGSSSGPQVTGSSTQPPSSSAAEQLDAGSPSESSSGLLPPSSRLEQSSSAEPSSSTTTSSQLQSSSTSLLEGSSSMGSSSGDPLASSSSEMASSLGNSSSQMETTSSSAAPPSCPVGYMGDTCTDCADGYQDNDLDGTCKANCSTAALVCDADATCQDLDGTAVCECRMGFGRTSTGCYDANWAMWTMPPAHPTDYTVGSETVLDNVTNLMWQRVLVQENTNANLAEMFCRRAVFGGYADWRLPTVIEMVSILDTTAYAPSINSLVFPNTPVYDFETGTFFGDSNTFTMSFFSGNTARGGSYRTDGGFPYPRPNTRVRCVRNN